MTALENLATPKASLIAQAILIVIGQINIQTWATILGMVLGTGTFIIMWLYKQYDLEERRREVDLMESQLKAGLEIRKGDRRNEIY